MKLEFDVTINDKDLYRFSMYHAYAGGSGILSIAIAMLAFLAAGRNGGSEPVERFLYIGFGALFLVYIPIRLYVKSKRQFVASKSLQNTLRYVVDDAGIGVSFQEETANISWDMVYKIVSTPNYVLIYTARRSAFLLPRKQLGDKYDLLRQIAKECLPKYRYKMK